MDAFVYFLEHTNDTFDVLPIFALILLILAPYLITYIIAYFLYKHEQCQLNLKQE